jgi:hypothetical protein
MRTKRASTKHLTASFNVVEARALMTPTEHISDVGTRTGIVCRDVTSKPGAICLPDRHREVPESNLIHE